MTKHFLLGISILPALLVMPAMAAAPNTTDTAFVFGDITAAAGTPLDYMAVGGRRISTATSGGKYRNDFPNYSMIGRSFEIPANSNPLYPATTLYVGPVNLTLRELTDNDVFRYNYQYGVAYDEETGQYVEIADHDTDVDLADWAGVVWNDDDVEGKLTEKIGADNASYTTGGVEMFSRRDNTKVAGSLSIAKTNATVDGTTVNANSISVTQGSTLTVANKATALLDTATRWYSVADQIASSGTTTLNAQTITFDGSTINLDHVVVKENNIPVGIRDAKLVINSETPTGITTIQNVASGYGALTVNGGGSLDLGGAELNFTNNTSTSHGAGLYYKDQSYGSGTQHGNNIAVLTASDITFSGNEVLASATSGSGAGVFLSGGKLSILGATNTFTDNHMNATEIANNRLYKTGGGAIANQSYDLESGQYGTAGSAIDADMIIGKADGSSVNMFTDNTSTTNGGAVMNRAEKTDGNATLTINGTTTFDNNSADINGGAIYNLARNGKTADVYMNNGTYTFTENSAGEFGGAIYNEGTMQLANATFGGVDSTDPQNPVSLGNTALKGGAILNSGSLTLSGGSFTGNTATGTGKDAANKDMGGGAIYSDLSTSVTDIDNVRFVGNSANYIGGAVYVYSGTANINNSTFTDNSANWGGAIYTKARPADGQQISDLVINNSTFTNNSAKGVGAVGVMRKGIITNTTFTDNHATDSTDDGAGALFLGAESYTTLTGGSFVDNGSAAAGGAIGTRDFVQGNNVDAKLDINGTRFEHNIAATTGGAIDNYFYNDAANDGYVNVSNATFTLNGAANGGAIYNHKAATQTGNMYISGSTFTSNTATAAGGAVYNEGELTFDGSTRFTTNTAALQGGALFNSASGEVVFKKLATFTGNQATGTATTEGGAINNAGTVTFEKNAVFTNNQADFGGAIVNDGGTLTLTEASVFQSNHANVIGGALFNDSGTVNLTDATFRSNTAVEGGAIANGGTINLNGTNTFVGNTANGHANDIANVGTLNITTGGTTTLNGGIIGSGILNIAEGATLNIGTASVAQNTINLNGTMLATLRSGDDAQITATSAFNGDGELKLAFDGEGLYHVFGNKVFAKENGIDLSSVVYDLTWSDDGRDVTASLKSVEDLAEENHLTNETAAAVINLTNSSSNVLNDLAVTIQEKLATGTDEDRQEVEHAQVAINPEKESVVQSVTSSVQNAVSSLAMSRMSMPMAGRNGGDAKVTGRGVWVNGIFNKAKQNDAFNGYTRGFAAGLDGTINNNLTIGAGYSFAHSDVDGSARDTEIESSSVFLYGQYRQKAWYVNGVANYTMADYSEKGTALGTPVTADYDVKSYGANVATGYRFAGGITPELSLRYLHIDGADYVNSLGIKNELKESDYLTAALGTKYAFRIKVTEAFRLRPELSYAVKYDMLSDKQVATVTMPGLNSYALDGDRLSRIAGEFGIGLGARYKGLDVSLNYDIEAREGYTSQSGRMKFRYNF